MRDFGKASFLHLQDRSGRIQAYVKRDVVGDEAFALFKPMDIGDFAGIVGRPFRTKTNELTIEAHEHRACSARRCARCRRSGTGSPTSKRATASATST